MAKGRGGGSHKGLPPGMTASHGPEGLEIATMAPRSDEIAEQHVQSSTQKDISDEVYPPPRAEVIHQTSMTFLRRRQKQDLQAEVHAIGER